MPISFNTIKSHAPGCRLGNSLSTLVNDLVSHAAMQVSTYDETVGSEMDATLYIIKYLEGGYSNLEGDKGSETIFGVASTFNSQFFERIRIHLERGEINEALNVTWDCYSQYSDLLIDNLFARGLNSCGLFLLSTKLWGYPYRIFIKAMQRHINDKFATTLDVDGVIGPMTFSYLSSISDVEICKLMTDTLFDQGADGFIAKFLEFCDRYPMFRTGFINRILRSSPLILNDCARCGYAFTQDVKNELCTNGNYSDGIVSYKPYQYVIGYVNDSQIISSILSERLLFALQIFMTVPAPCRLRLDDFVLSGDYKSAANQIKDNIIL